jgi:DegV family protein with EDD domain
MSKVKIITDSNSGIKIDEGRLIDVFVVPMPFTIDGEEYFEEISMDHEKFFNLLRNGADVKTSQPSQMYLENLWSDVLKDYDEIVYLPMMSGLSSSCENAKKYAKNFKGKVFVVDNKRISVTLKESVLEAVELVKMGKTGSEIKDYLESTSSKASIYISLDTLKYLKKGGRISPLAATIGQTLKLKPVLYTRGANFDKFAITFSTNQAKKKMIAQIKKELETEFKKEFDAGVMTVSVAHTRNFDEAEKFKQEIISEIPNVKFRFVDELSLSVCCHIGEGALAVALSINNYIN